MRIVLLLASLFVTEVATAGGFKDGNWLYAQLEDWRAKPSRSIVDAAEGAGYVLGVFDQDTERLWCPTDGVNFRQVLDIVFKFLNENPAIRNQSASSLVSRALMSAFPCK
jgi:hypothetical protein